MKETEKRILLFIKIPPPITGATLMNKYVFESKLLKENFIIRSVLISYAKSVNNLGKLNLNKLIIFIKIFITLIKECIYHRPQFIYFQISPLGIAFLRDLIFVSLMKLFHIKIVYHLHGKGIKKMVENNFLAMLYKYAFRNSEIICLSSLLKDDLEDVFKGTIHIVNNGIPDVFEEKIFYSQRVRNIDKIQILFLSNLIRSKGIMEFIESLKILADKNIDFRANIVGSEGDIKYNYLNDKITEYNLTNKIIYLGTKYGKEKNDTIAKCDVFVYPSFYFNDAFPLVILEAMQFSKPVIATREGAIPQIVDDGVTGFLVDKHNPEQISEKLEVFINNPELIKTMGAAGRKKYEEKYTIKIFEKNMDLVFKTFLENIN
jgi:glycosyltransferase involved in cell wall biosynthesis